LTICKKQLREWYRFFDNIWLTRVCISVRSLPVRRISFNY